MSREKLDLTVVRVFSVLGLNVTFCMQQSVLASQDDTL